jgi:hypothetical protein
MKSKRNKRAPADSQEQNRSHLPTERELVLKQKKSVSTTTPNAGTHEVPDKEWAQLSPGDSSSKKQIQVRGTDSKLGAVASMILFNQVRNMGTYWVLQCKMQMRRRASCEVLRAERDLYLIRKHDGMSPA